MKHWFAVICTLITLFYSYTISAQSKLSLGPELGLGLNLYPTEIGTGTSLGSHLGIKTSYRLDRHFSIYTGIYYTQKKIQYTAAYTETTESLNSLLVILGSIQDLPFDPSKAFNTDSKILVNGLATAQFIEIPVLCSYNYEGIELFAGPYIGFLTSIKDKQIRETSIPFVETVNYKEIAGGLAGGLLTNLSPPAYEKTEKTVTSNKRFNKLDFGFTVGMGYQFKNVNMNVSYTHGLLDYRENPQASDDPITYKTLRFSMVYLFHFKNKKDKLLPKSSGI